MQNTSIGLFICAFIFNGKAERNRVVCEYLQANYREEMNSLLSATVNRSSWFLPLTSSLFLLAISYSLSASHSRAAGWMC